MTGLILIAPGIARPQAAPPAVSTLATTEYAGPMGLKWSQSCSEVRKILSKRLTFVRQAIGDQGKSIIQRYTGTFAEHPFARIEVVCNPATKQMFGVTVTLPAKDVRPALIRWQEMVEQTIKKYGPPTSGTLELLPKGETGMSGLLAAQLEVQVQHGTLVPKAEWQFKNAVVCVLVTAGDPDRGGNRAVEPSWLFTGPGAQEGFGERRGDPDL